MDTIHTQAYKGFLCVALQYPWKLSRDKGKKKENRTFCCDRLKQSLLLCITSNWGSWSRMALEKLSSDLKKLMRSVQQFPVKLFHCVLACYQAECLWCQSLSSVGTSGPSGMYFDPPSKRQFFCRLSSKSWGLLLCVMMVSFILNYSLFFPPYCGSSVQNFEEIILSLRAN